MGNRGAARPGAVGFFPQLPAQAFHTKSLSSPGNPAGVMRHLSQMCNLTLTQNKVCLLEAGQSNHPHQPPPHPPGVNLAPSGPRVL